MQHTRRSFLAAGTGLLLTFEIGGCSVQMTARDARERGLPYSELTEAEAAQLAALGEVLLPGATAAGLVHFVDTQLAAPPDRQLLMLKYLRVDPPFAAFYRAGLTALETACRAAHGQSFAMLPLAHATEIVKNLGAGKLAAWSGPPSPLFYFVVRNDAIDVVYGTQSGFERLGISYMAHIDPPTEWQA
jgi:hypothetical protein